MKSIRKIKVGIVFLFSIAVAVSFGVPSLAQLIDRTQNPNTAGAGANCLNKSAARVVTFPICE